MEVMVILFIIALTGWAIVTQVKAREQIDIPTPLSEQDAARIVFDHFGPLWTQVAGAGHLNYRPKFRAGAPTVSIALTPTGMHGCTVSIWTSTFSTRYGLMTHAQLAWRKKQTLADKLVTTTHPSAQRRQGT